jgi:DNA-directed RNA polymerase subunit RPC12/RpoP
MKSKAFESRRSKPRTKFSSSRNQFSPAEYASENEKGFKCIHCQYTVYTEPMISGVQNRNHCPYCLWSKHVDLKVAGDRLAACRSMMKPVGITIKLTLKKYGNEKTGELMLIHYCVECGKLSINRLAADDDAEAILEIFKNYPKLDAPFRSRIEGSGISALTAADRDIVQAQLFGR